MGKDRRLFGITGYLNTVALDTWVWYSTVCERRCRFMAAWVDEEEKASEHRQRKIETEEADKVAPGVTVASLRRFLELLRMDRPKDSPSGVGCADREA